MKTLTPHSDAAFKYAEKVISGKIDACKWVKLACERQLNDLKRIGSRGFPFVFDKEKAEIVCNFVETMPHIKGEWSKRKENIVLQPWQQFILTTVFGWVDKDSDLRRFRYVYLELPRKNAKSTLTAAVANFMLTADGEEGAEVYSGATSEKQGRIVFEIARAMAKKAKGFASYYGLEINKHNLSVQSTYSKFEAVCALADSNEGLNPHFGALDELHAHKTRDMHDVFQLAKGSRQQPILWEISTSGEDLAGICYEQHTYFTQLLDGTFKDERSFGMIYCADEKDTWRKESTWKKANPNYGVSVYRDDMKSMATMAERSASTLMSFKTKRLNLWQGSDVTWMNLLYWDQCQADLVPLEDIKDKTRRCWLGLDLATKIDIASVVVLVENDMGGLDFYERHYCPAEKVHDESGVHTKHYAGWAMDEHLQLTPGNVIDFRVIEDFVIELNKRLNIQQCAFDPFQAMHTAILLNGLQNITMVEIKPDVPHFSTPMKELEAMVIDKKIRHGGNPVTRWMMSNVVCWHDLKDNIYPRKRLNKPENKIDGVVAAIMAMNRYMERVKEIKSVYSTRGIMTI